MVILEQRRDFFIWRRRHQGLSCSLTRPRSRGCRRHRSPDNSDFRYNLGGNFSPQQWLVLPVIQRAPFKAMRAHPLNSVLRTVSSCRCHQSRIACVRCVESSTNQFEYRRHFQLGEITSSRQKGQKVRLHWAHWRHGQQAGMTRRIIVHLFRRVQWKGTRFLQWILGSVSIFFQHQQ
jgi:hypothetical protein